MALSYNLGYQESISVHPTRRQNFAGKPYSNFPNIWQWLISVSDKLIGFIPWALYFQSYISSNLAFSLAQPAVFLQTPNLTMSSLDTLHHRSEWWTTWCQWWNRWNWPQFMQDLKKSMWRLKLAAIYAKFFASGKSTFHSEINQKPVLFLCNSPLFLSEIQRCICFIFKNRKKFMFSFTEQKCSILDISIYTIYCNQLICP